MIRMEENNMDITRCLTISTAHVSKETISLLEKECKSQDILPVIAYKKGDYGFWVYCPDDMMEYFGGGENVPNDLWECMLVAYEHDCRWLCLDRDGEVVEKLLVYEW